MFLEMWIKITSLLLLGCTIAAQSIYLTGELMLNNGTTIEDDHLKMKILISDPTTPNSKIILPSNSNQRKYSAQRSDMYQRLKIRSLEIRPLATKEDDGGEKPRGQQVSKVSQREMARINAEVGTDYDHREQNYVRVVQGEIFHPTDERNPLVKKEEEEVDLGFLDDLGGLAPYLPDAENSNVSLNKEESFSGFFNWLLSMLGLTSPVVDETMIRDEKSTEPKFNESTSASSGSFFNWLLSMLGLTSPVVDATIRDKRFTDSKFSRSTLRESEKLDETEN